MSKYSNEFKMDAVKKLAASGSSVNQMAEELGVHDHTLRSWIKRYGQNEQSNQNDGPLPENGKVNNGKASKGKVRSEDAKFKKLEKENRELREEIAMLKNLVAYLAKNLK